MLAVLVVVPLAMVALIVKVALPPLATVPTVHAPLTVI